MIRILLLAILVAVGCSSSTVKTQQDTQKERYEAHRKRVGYTIEKPDPPKPQWTSADSLRLVKRAMRNCLARETDPYRCQVWENTISKMGNNPPLQEWQVWATVAEIDRLQKEHVQKGKVRR